MNTSTKFDWHYVALQKLKSACAQALSASEMSELGNLEDGKAEGALLLIPVLSCGSRDQSMHCMLLLWGESCNHKTLDDIVKFVGVNFPDCRFYAVLCDLLKS